MIYQLAQRISDILDRLWPPVTDPRNRDYGAALVAAEEECEVHEPAIPSLDSLFEAYWAAQTPEVETQALDDIDRYYPEWGRYSRPIEDSATLGAADPSPTPAGDDRSAEGVGTPSTAPSAELPGLRAVIDCELRKHVVSPGRGTFDCWCHRKFVTIGDWSDHVSDLIAERIEKAQRPTQIETGHDMGMTHAAEFFPQHRK